MKFEEELYWSYSGQNLQSLSIDDNVTLCEAFDVLFPSENGVVFGRWVVKGTDTDMT